MQEDDDSTSVRGILYALDWESAEPRLSYKWCFDALARATPRIHHNISSICLLKIQTYRHEHERSSLIIAQRSHATYAIKYDYTRS